MPLPPPSRCARPLPLGPILALALAVASLPASPAGAAPIQRQADYFLSFALQGLGPIGFGGTTRISVDFAAETLDVAAGALSLASPLIVPITATTAVSSVTATAIANQAGSFSVGGADVPGELCPPDPDSACVAGGGLGGPMGFVGSLRVHIVSDVVVIPLDLDLAGIGRGGAITSPFVIDAAPWTTRTAAIRFSGSLGDRIGSTLGAPLTSDGFSLVTPAYVQALGFLVPS
ncbi:MAG: hypothetical protein HKP30_15765, partial [Myxococcales bacterium]|nr:hypothetical protein [Myxococcales bacterium]